MDVAAGVLSERQKRDYQGARGKRRYVYADEAAQYWLVSNARLLQKTILFNTIRHGPKQRALPTRALKLRVGVHIAILA
jgi:hypothetical protein